MDLVTLINMSIYTKTRDSDLISCEHAGGSHMMEATKEVPMSSLAMRRARERYGVTKHIPHTGRGRSGHHAGNIVIWVAGVGLVLFVMWYWGLAAIFWR